MICFVEPDDIKKAWQYWIYIGLHSSYIVTPQRSLICINALLNSYLSTIFQHLWYKRFPNNRIQVIFSLGPKHSYIWTSWRRMMYGTGKKNMCVFHSAKSITENTHMEQWCIEGFCEICCVQSTWGHRATLKFFGTDGVNYCKQQLFTFTKIQTGKIIQSFFFLDLCYRQTLSLCFWQNWRELVFSSLARQLPGRPSETGCQLWALDPRLAVSHK